MTDNEIRPYDGMSSLEQLNLYRNLHYCEGLANERGIIANAINDIIVQFNRQKAEIENYSHNNKNMTKDIRKLQKALEQAKAEVERLKKAKVIYSTVDYCEGDLTEALRENERLKAEVERYKQALRNAEQYCHSLVKEMAGEADGRGHKDDCCQSQNENNAQ